MMNKNILILFFFGTLVLMTSFLFACSDPEVESEMNRIAIRNESLKRTVDSLQDEINILHAQNDSVKKTLKSLDMHK